VNSGAVNVPNLNFVGRTVLESMRQPVLDAVDRKNRSVIAMNNLQLPDTLLADLSSGRRPLSAHEKIRLASLLKAVSDPWPELYGLRGIEMENRLWTSEYVQFYLGEENSDYKSGTIDPSLACIIGHAEPDGPIALDYRVAPPRVIYLGGGIKSVWIELAPTYESLIAAISDP